MSTGNVNKMTDKLSKVSIKVTDLTVKELQEAAELHCSSRVLYQIDHLMEVLDEGYVLNQYEQQAFDAIIERFNTVYRSPLSTAMTEGKDEA